jgi:hypothetical protein
MGFCIAGSTKQRPSLALDAYSTKERVLGQTKFGKEDLSVVGSINSRGTV